jgi:DNA-binding IclR family transcriptional regulator
MDADNKYMLGPRLLELGYLAHNQRPLTRVARRHLQMLARETNHTVNLGCLEGMKIRYLDIVSSDRRVELKVHIGKLQSVRNTAVGKALIMDFSEQKWREYYHYEDCRGADYSVGLEDWVVRMRRYAEEGVALDIEENPDRIRCVAGPIRDASSQIVGALSVSSLSQYMDDEQMEALKPIVRDYTQRISRELGCLPKPGGAS